MIYTFTHPHNLGQLLGELIAQIPALAPVPDVNPITPGALRAVFSLSGDGTTLWIDVPDAVSEATVAAVVDAHVAKPDAVAVPPPSVAEKVASVLLTAPELTAATRAALETALTGRP